MDKYDKKQQEKTAVDSLLGDKPPNSDDNATSVPSSTTDKTSTADVTSISVVVVSAIVGALLTLVLLGLIGFSQMFGALTTAAATVFAAIISGVLGAVTKKYF